jgi:glycerate 2-kinase
VRALACPASYKGALTAVAAARALAGGLLAGGLDADECPVADGGEGTAEVLHAALGGEWRVAEVADPLGRPVRARWLLLPDGRGVVETSAAIGLPLLAPDELDPLLASSRGFGELVAAALDAGATSLLLCLGGTATVDGGAGMREALAEAPGGLRNTVLQGSVAACDVATRLGDAARLYGPQKGASPADVDELGRRLAADPVLAPYAGLDGSGAAGGIGAAAAALGAELVPGAELVLATIGFRGRLAGAVLAVTGEGELDATTAEGKAPAAVAGACAEAGVRCVVAAGRVVEPLPGTEPRALSGDLAATETDLRALGEELALALLGGA